jgi:hypothetical protein
MPPRTTRKSYRPRVSDRTMVGTVQPHCLFAQTYSTSFPLIENPISERGKWAGGQSAGGNLWGDVRTSGGMAFGVSEPTTFGDPTAILTGSWAANQEAEATVKINSTPTVCCHEIEVRLRVTISAKSITGYEVYCSIVPGNKYCHIARWSGPNGLYCNIERASPSIILVDGDVLKGTVTGSNPALITGYLNGVKIMQVSDTGNERGEGRIAGQGGPCSLLARRASASMTTRTTINGTTSAWRNLVRTRNRSGPTHKPVELSDSNDRQPDHGG